MTPDLRNDDTVLCLSCQYLSHSSAFTTNKQTYLRDFFVVVVKY